LIKSEEFVGLGLFYQFIIGQILDAVKVFFWCGVIVWVKVIMA
jgi:hypothetical protein